MEIRIAKDQFKHFSFHVYATMAKGILTLNDERLHIQNVPFDGCADESGVTAFIHRDCIKNAGSSVKVATWDTSAEPKKIDRFEVNNVSVDGLKDSFSWLYKSTSRDEGRPNLLGVCVQTEGGVVDMAATDGHRLGWDRMTNGVDCGNMKVILHRDVIATALKLAGKKGDLGILSIVRNYSGTRIVDSLVTFSELSGYYWKNAIVNLEYPQFEKVVPKSGFKFEPCVYMSTLKTFADKARKVKVKNLKYKTTNPATMIMTFADGFLTLSITDDNGEVTQSDCWTDYKGDSFRVAYNPAYLFDALTGFTGDSDGGIKMLIMGEASCCVIADRDRKAVIMPVRI